MRELLMFLWALYVATAICVSVDASRLGARRGVLGGGLLDMGPAAWFFACLLFWIVALPCYLATRPRLVRRARALEFVAAQSQAGAQPAWGRDYAYATAAGPWAPSAGHVLTPPALSGPPPAPVGPPPGYYPNPIPGGTGTRWWDGSRWEFDQM